MPATPTFSTNPHRMHWATREWKKSCYLRDVHKQEALAYRPVAYAQRLFVRSGHRPAAAWLLGQVFTVPSQVPRWVRSACVDMADEADECILSKYERHAWKHLLRSPKQYNTAVILRGLLAGRNPRQAALLAKA